MRKRSSLIVTARGGTSLKAVASMFGVLLVLILLRPPAVSAAESEYRRCDLNSVCTIGEFLYDDNYTPIPPANAGCTLSIANPAGTPLPGSPFTMSESADGWYYHNFDTTGQAGGLHRSTMCCTVTTPSSTLCLDKSFIVGGIADSVWSYTTRTLTNFGTLVANIWNNLTRSLTTREITLTEHIAQEEALQKHWTTRFAGDGELLAGKTYRCKLWVLNYETELTDAVTIPTLTIYDAERNIPPGAPTVMTKIPGTTGTYECVYNVPSTAVGGRWETVVNVDVGGAATIQDGSYWEVESSPAEVKINAITDNTVPSITANVTITNEGGSWYEYRYAYCVVAQENNACGGGDDVFYNSGSKKLLAGESWTTNFNATVPNPGQYWFKVVVQWGTERSGASQVFTATSGAVCLGDLNSDGWVDLTDFSILLFYWNTSSPIADLNGDGKVNLTDFSIMLFHWGKCP